MIAALYCRKNSVYRQFPGVDVFDLARDARTFPGDVPVVAHPPCGAWGRLRQFSKAAPAVRDLALHALATVRKCGGVLEHPAASVLFPMFGIDVRAGHPDAFGGYCVVLPQRWFGHRADKLSAFYVVGVAPSKLPEIPFSFSPPITTIERMGKAERERTPLALATWLVAVAKLAQVKQ